LPALGLQTPSTDAEALSAHVVRSG
jgi:hypothetical protein